MKEWPNKRLVCRVEEEGSDMELNSIHHRHGICFAARGRRMMHLQNARVISLRIHKPLFVESKVAFLSMGSHLFLFGRVPSHSQFPGEKSVDSSTHGARRPHRDRFQALKSLSPSDDHARIPCQQCQIQNNQFPPNYCLPLLPLSIIHCFLS
jgi:hypothetical protein